MTQLKNAKVLLKDGKLLLIDAPEKADDKIYRKTDDLDEVWKDAENQLIKFLTDNEDKIIPMPTPMSMDICIFLKSKFYLTRL